MSIKDKGESTIFRNNVIFYNAVFLPAFASVMYDKLHPKSERTTQIVPTLVPNGAMVLVSRNF